MENKTLIKGNRISIVEMNLTMANDVWKNSLDEDNRRFVPDEVFETLEEAKEMIEAIMGFYESEDGPFIYAVIRNCDNANMGYVQLVQIPEGWEIGYHIGEKYTRQGYATEAVNLFLDYLKKNTNHKLIYGVALSDNLASRRVLEKCGFKLIFEGQSLYQGHEAQIIKSIKEL